MLICHRQFPHFLWNTLLVCFTETSSSFPRTTKHTYQRSRPTCCNTAPQLSIAAYVNNATRNAAFLLNSPLSPNRLLAACAMKCDIATLHIPLILPTSEYGWYSSLIPGLFPSMKWMPILADWDAIWPQLRFRRGHCEAFRGSGRRLMEFFSSGSRWSRAGLGMWPS